MTLGTTREHRPRFARPRQRPAGLFNSSRQAGGALAVAVFGALVSNRVSFGSGMRTSLLIAAALLLATTAAALALPGRRTADLR